ncbi:hypothetical protein CRG98_040376, partial [Punica granatum]
NILENLRECFTEKKTEVENLMERTLEVKRTKGELQDLLTLDEEFEIKAKISELQNEIEEANEMLNRMKEEENSLSEKVNVGMNEFQQIANEVDDLEKKHYETVSRIRELKQHQTNKVTAFGGDRVIHLLRVIERFQGSFGRPPIGPIGSHLSLVNGDMWAPAVENALGKLLNAFIVASHKDSLVLRKCAKEANYNHLPIIIYDFSRPRLNIPRHMLPRTDHPTALSVLQSENVTVLNVLVDMGNIERQVLVRDYDVGKTVAFNPSISNVKEVFTLDGYKMFSRNGVETILPPIRNRRSGRLCSSFDDQIADLEKEARRATELAGKQKMRKREADATLNNLRNNLHNLKRIKDEIQEKETELEQLKIGRDEADAKARALRLSFEDLCESANGEIDALGRAEAELMKIEEKIESAEAEKAYYEKLMGNKVLNDIKVAEEQYCKLERDRKENFDKASLICPESEIKSLGEWDGSTPEQLSAQVSRLDQRLQDESRQCSESIDDLRMMYKKKQRKVSRKQEMYKVFREKLKACWRALNSRQEKFEESRRYLKNQLIREFNSHLNKKGFSGGIKISFKEKTLSVEVKMPQDASRDGVRDTRGLSGGERSFSTLCFSLALHGMTVAPFRAMDEFDVFMDAVSRKISLNTLVEFALAQGSQWIFITPHDISMVKPEDRVKKQQMAAPRS